MTSNVNIEKKEWELRDYVDLFYRRIWLIISVFVVIFAGTVVYQLSRPDFYGSYTVFTIDDTINSSGVGAERFSPYYFGLKEGKPLEYYQSIVGSQIYIEKVLDLAIHDSSFTPLTPEREEEILYACNSLSLTMEEESRVMTLYVSAKSALVSYRVAEIAAEAFRERNQAIELQVEQDVVRFIDKQRQEVQDRLEQAERELQRYDGASAAYFMNEDGSMISKLNQVETLLEQAETQRRLAETNLASFVVQLNANKQPISTLASTDVVPEIANMRQRLIKLENQRNSLLVADKVDSQAISRLYVQIESMKNELRRSIMSHSQELLPEDDKKSMEMRNMLTQRLVAEQIELSSTRNKELFYSALLEQYRRQSPELLEKAIELSRLKRTQIVHQNLLNYLVERHEEAKIKAATGAGGIRIINPAAMPLEPLSSNAMRNLIVGVIFALGLGFGLAMLLDYLDQTVRTKEELQLITGLDVVGQIPFHAKPNGRSNFARKELNNFFKRIKKEKKEHRHRDPEYYPLLNHVNLVNLRDPFIEAFRSLRTDLLFYRIDQPPKKILITSAVPGEGKSLITANLGLAYAELGYRVVIVDLDLRRPKQAQLFSINRKPGLVDYLLGLTTFDHIVRPTKMANLFLIPPGTLPPNPTEIINSKKMSTLINKLEQKYDYVLVDSSPIISLSDAKTLSRMIQHVLMVFRFAQTEKRYIMEAVSSLRGSNAEIIGIVMNGIDFGLGKGYYKYNYYYSYYTKSPEEREIVEEAEVN